VVQVLLPALVRQRSVCARLPALPAWQALLAAFAGRKPLLAAGLGQKLQRGLAQARAELAACFVCYDFFEHIFCCRYIGTFQRVSYFSYCR
jgi:hypothetical protein